MQTATQIAATFDARRLRSILAMERITRRRFAEACGLGPVYITRLLNGKRQPGELALIKLERGLAALGLRLESEGAA